MHLTHLSLADFRSYERAELALTPGTTTLVGPNGQGKTNLVEAVGYLATLGSHRVAQDAPLVRQGAERALVRAAVATDPQDPRTTLLEVEIAPGRANRARVNRSPVPRAREILGTVRTVLFAPEDLALVKGDPADRRRFLDAALVSRAPRLAGVKSDYDRVLKQRSALVKSAGVRTRAARGGGTAPDLSTLDVWDSHLATAGADLVAARLSLLAEITPLVAAAYAEVAAGDPAEIGVGYRSSIGPDVPPEADADQLRGAMLAALQDRRREELDRGLCLVGPHRDDLVLTLRDMPAKGYASHGESWSFALALRLACFQLFRDLGSDPVLILDDVFAELDARRRARLADLVADAEQVLITAAVAEDVPDQLVGSRVDVTAGELRRVA